MSQDDPKKPANAPDSEPTAGFATVPIWIIMIFGALFYCCQLYLSGHAGGFNSQVYAPYASYDQVFAANPKSEGDEMMLMGKDVFDHTCVACHQPGGIGKEGTAPPLVGSEWVLAAGPERIAHVVLNGLTGPITVKGKDWNLTMVPWRDVYDDKHLAAVLSYVRNSWGNKASLVKPEQIAAARKDIHPGPMTVPELEQISIP
jgi:mono/diheme cytochrome c family protein